jgi:hypothetical protein
MLRDEFHGVIQIARLKHKDSADLLLGLRVRTVSYPDFAVLQAHGFGGVEHSGQNSSSRMSQQPRWNRA